MRLFRSLIVLAACGLALLPIGTASAKFVPPKLNYVAITPCRIIDTRPTGGPFAAKETRSYSLNGGATQGGTGCTVYSGANAPFAVAVNVTVDATALGSPSQYGYIALLPQNPTGTSWMNFAGGQIIANAGVATVNQADGTFSIKSQLPANVIVDVLGYYQPSPDVHLKSLTLAAPGFTSLMSIAILGNATTDPLASPTPGAPATAGGRIFYTVVATDGVSQIATEEGVIQYLATANSITCTVQTTDKLHLGTVNSGCTPGFFNPGSQPGISIFDNVTFSSPAPIALHYVYFNVEDVSGSTIRYEP